MNKMDLTLGDYDCLLIKEIFFDDKLTEAHCLLCLLHNQINRHSVGPLRFHYSEGLLTRGYHYVDDGSGWC